MEVVQAAAQPSGILKLEDHAERGSRSSASIERNIGQSKFDEQTVGGKRRRLWCLIREELGERHRKDSFGRRQEHHQGGVGGGGGGASPPPFLASARLASCCMKIIPIPC